MFLIMLPLHQNWTNDVTEFKRIRVSAIFEIIKFYQLKELPPPRRLKIVKYE